MPKILFSSPIADWDGEPLMLPPKKPGEDPVPVTLGEVVRTALNHVAQGETSPSFEQAVKRGTLAGEIRKAEKSATAFDLDAADIVLIRERIPKAGFVPWIVAVCAALLDGKAPG